MAGETSFRISIKTAPMSELDRFALSACQKDNYGNETDWFGHFRGGLFAFDSRIYGVKIHYERLHAWAYDVRHPTETEYHIASLLFNMDSAVECFVYLLNALGSAAKPAGFRSVTCTKGLGAISPADILGTHKDSSPRCQGYSDIFPRLQDLWNTERELLFQIFDLHDVSKHRRTIYSGGMLRRDEPPAFFESVGVQNDVTKRLFLTPHAEILLKADPKVRHPNSVPARREELWKLESIVERYAVFIERSCALALEDAATCISLPGRKPDESTFAAREWVREGDNSGSRLA